MVGRRLWLRRVVTVRRGLVALWVAALAAGCAREEAPPGNLPDTRPPQIVETRPEEGAIVPGFEESLRIRFDEPVNVSRSYLRQVDASPAWRLTTAFGFSDVRLRPEGGWRDGVVYTFHFPPDLADILGNRREEGFSLRFSTGPPISPTRASGRLLRRVDGSGIRDGRVIFLADVGDSVPYSAVSDTGGVFELEALPPGRYTAWGFEDLNANLQLDARLEPYDSARFELADSTAAARITLRVVEPDTTPPRLASAEAVDSVTVRLEFDDPLEPEQDTAAVRIAVADTATGGAWPVEAWGVGGLPAPEDTVTADSLVSDTAAADTAAAPGEPDSIPADAAVADTVAPRLRGGEGIRGLPGAGAAAGREASGDTIPLPSREVVVRLGRPLEDGSVYRARAAGLANLRGLVGGGDTTFVYETVEDTAAADSVARDTAAAADTAASPDSVGAGGVPAGADTTTGRDTAVPPDTAAPPDTSSAPAAVGRRPREGRDGEERERTPTAHPVPGRRHGEGVPGTGGGRR